MLLIYQKCDLNKMTVKSFDVLSTKISPYDRKIFENIINSEDNIFLQDNIIFSVVYIKK